MMMVTCDHAQRPVDHAAGAAFMSVSVETAQSPCHAAVTVGPARPAAHLASATRQHDTQHYLHEAAEL